MSNVRCINFWDLCRICTASSEQKINIYSPDGRAKNLSHKISECLPVQIDEKDRLPKVVCAQCAHQVEQMYEMRNISKNSQTILSNWLNHRTLQTEDKVFIKDAINDAGKSLNVVGTATQSSNQPNDLLSSIIQAVGMQVQQQPLQQQQQYTITVDSHVQAHPQLPPPPPPQQEVKSEKQNTLEEFIRLKPDIKITPLGKKDNVNSSPGTSSVTNGKQQQQHHQQQQQQHQPQQQQQLSAQTLTAVSAPAAQIQLQPQQLNELNVLLQQQALLQQLQQLQAQSQSQFTSCADDGMGSADKKPKLNFVLSSPAAAPQFAGSLQQFGGISGAQPQIQLQLLPGGSGTASNATAVQQPQQFNAAALLSSLTGTQVVGGNGASNMLSPNKCFLPITIRDENSDQQIVAHIDTKNLVLPTTYQVQMKLQPQLATADGQPIMQLTPTSIPATLQLTPQTLGNATSFQSASTMQQNQFLVPQSQLQQQQQPQQHQPQQQQHQSPQQQQHQSQQQQQHQPQQQQHQQHQPQQLPPTTAQVTSQQIIRSPRSNPINSQLIIRNVSSEPSTPTSSSTDASVKFKTPSPRQQPQQQVKFKATPPNVTSIGAVAATAAASNNNANTEYNKRVGLVKQPTAASNNVAALQRLSSNTTITKLTKPQQSGTSNKLPVLNKQNITISRISAQAPPKPEPKPPQVAAPAQIPSAPKPQPPPPPALAMQQLPQPVATNVVTSIANQRKINRKPPEQPVNQRLKTARPQQQILPVPSQQTTTTPQQQQQLQQQETSTLASDTPAATPASALTCPTCRREFKKKEHLTQHVKLHAGLRPFKCSEEGCDKAFSRKEHLSRHLVSHSGQKMFTCEDCKKPFSRKDNLNKHKRTHSAQPGETRLHSCEICNKNFASKQHYEKHREMHKKSRLDNGAPTTQPAGGSHQTAKAQDIYEVKSAETATPQTQTQPAQTQMQIQQQHQPQIMHVDLDGSTITITQASDSTMQSSLANFVQLGFSQFQNSSGPANQIVCKLEK
ncbi:alpha-protein kinase 1 [Drosophila innubila]|uniref:alpha-protein kinase 1 n=1 Tax=Drosophila innubila TaxID=198719 RepID=UPI00148CBBD4|nr:alpha-protein kinase 1 [Drosophila innubila]